MRKERFWRRKKELSVRQEVRLWARNIREKNRDAGRNRAKTKLWRGKNEGKKLTHEVEEMGWMDSEKTTAKPNNGMGDGGEMEESGI